MEEGAGHGHEPVSPVRAGFRPLPLVAMLILSLSLTTALAVAGETRTVEVTAEVYGLGRTPEEAKREALQRARDKAVAQVAGIQISAQQLRLKSESPDAVRDAFSYLVQASTSGRIVREEVGYQTELVDDIPVYRATLRAEVALEEGLSDPGFALEIATKPASHVYRDGEAIVVELSATRDCYVTVLNIGVDGSVSRLFPNAYDRENRLVSGRTLRLPRPGHGFEILATSGKPGSTSQEQILAVATLDAVPFDLEGEPAQEIVPEVAREAAVTALNHWLLKIPVSRRTEAMWTYEVVK